MPQFRTSRRDGHVYPLAHKSRHRYYTDRKPRNLGDVWKQEPQVEDVEDVEQKQKEDAERMFDEDWELHPSAQRGPYYQPICEECGATGPTSWFLEELGAWELDHFRESGHKQFREDKIHPTWMTDERPQVVFPFYTDKRVHEFDEVEYAPEKFPGLVYRPASHTAALTTFPSGKVVVVGATSERQGRELVKEYAETLRERGFPVEEPKVSTQSVVMTSDLGTPLDLEAVEKAVS